METVQDLPEYQSILKMVLKSQIKQLVEQLSSLAGEEAILLSASLTDGTMSHIGSESGEVFLRAHGQVKTQFLGFCLKRHQFIEKQQEKSDYAKALGLSDMPVGDKSSEACNMPKETIVSPGNDSAGQYPGGSIIPQDVSVNSSDLMDTSVETIPDNEDKNTTQISSELSVNIPSSSETDGLADTEASASNSVETHEAMYLVKNDDSGETMVVVKEEPNLQMFNYDASGLMRACESSGSAAGQSTMDFVHGTFNPPPNIFSQYEREKKRYSKIRRLNHFSIARKYATLIEVEAGHKSKSQIAKELNIPQNTLSCWIKASQQIKDAYLCSDYDPNRKRTKRAKFPDIEQALMDWLRDAKNHNIWVSSIVVMEKANEIARDLGYTEEQFLCTVNWVERFKVRFGLTAKKYKKT